jgi:hypothetical protein
MEAKKPPMSSAPIVVGISGVDMTEGRQKQAKPPVSGTGLHIYDVRGAEHLQCLLRRHCQHEHGDG